MQLPLETQTILVENMSAAVQAASSTPVDLSTGSVTLALLESDAAVGLWMQYLAVLILSVTRLATSTGSDCDSFVNDFGMTRLPAVAASGAVTFSRFTPTNSATIPLGATVETADLSQSFAVIEDTTNAFWNAPAGGYAIAAGIASASVPVQAVVAGSAGNVQAGAISLITQAIPGVDTVSNPSAFTNGLDAESDAALRARFVNFINSRSQATPNAVAYAVTSLQQGLDYLLQENQDTAGNYRPGNFVVTVDDGTGNPPSTLLSEVYGAIDAIRPLGSTFAVQPPQVVQTAVSLSITTNPPGTKTSLLATVSNAISAYVNALPIGASLPLSRVAQIAYGVDPSIVNVTNVALNGAAQDMVPPANGVIKTNSVVVS